MSDANDPNSYVFPFRPNYEGKIILIWLAASVAFAVTPLLLDVPERPYWVFALLSIVLGLYMGRYGIEIHIRKSRLKGYPLEFIDPNSHEAMKLFGITDKEVIENVKKHRK